MYLDWFVLMKEEKSKYQITMKPLKILLSIILLASFVTSKADDYPWRKYGFDLKVVTLSNGKYQEFHDLEDVVEIGSVLFNTQTQQIVGFVEKDTLYSEAGLTPYIVSRWISPDPLSEEYSSWSPYNYATNNPIRFIDPNGMMVDEYKFNSEGQYTGKVEKEGEHYGTISNNNGEVTKTFSFADPINDPAAIDKGEITQVVEVGDEAIANTLNESGVNNGQNQDNRVDFILNESNATNPEGSGKMDYVITGSVKVDGKDIKLANSSNTLFLTSTESGKVAHNNSNFGNFLWGAGVKSLGIPKFTAKLGAHYNNFFHDPKHKGTLDSKDDQYSISLGYERKK
jgi:uncharacterized protein RhaS with RHS repeats